MGDREGRASATEESSAEPNGRKLCARQGSGEGAGGTRVRTMSKIKAPDPPGFYGCKGGMQTCLRRADMHTSRLVWMAGDRRDRKGFNIVTQVSSIAVQPH